MTVDELRERFNLSRATINSYVYRGIMPPPLGGRGHGARYDQRHIDAINAYNALKHFNIHISQVVSFCREEGITLPQYVERRWEAIKIYGLGIS